MSSVPASQFVAPEVDADPDVVALDDRLDWRRGGNLLERIDEFLADVEIRLCGWLDLVVGVILADDFDGRAPGSSWTKETGQCSGSGEKSPWAT